ncbi:MAG: serine/threonine protein kinase [Kiritimatiellae bacterium]|nr:serine/threonine protein kinase [Kiritimatiellia bacterium]
MNPELEALARELDELGKTPARRELDVPPDFGGSDWRLVRPIGRGTMGTVYEAEQISLARKVAVKVMPMEVSANPSRRARFLREAKTLAMLHHPNIVKVYAAGTAGERLFYAMDLVQGTDLRDAKPVGAEDVAILGLSAAQALAYAHRCGVIHQDVKPANLLVDGEGNLHLADFGIAALLQGANYVISSGGTRRYMAPEMQNGRGIASPASDQYALGVTLRELANAAKDNRIPPELSAIFRKMTAPVPNARYPDMEAVADELRRFLRHEPVRAQPPSPFRRFSLWMRRNPAAAIGTATAAVCLVGFILALAFGFVQSRRALAQTQAALAQTEAEAAHAAQALAEALTITDINEPDKRDGELQRALSAAEELANRFPSNADITAAVAQLKKARENHARFLKLRNGLGRRPLRRPPPKRQTDD